MCNGGVVDTMMGRRGLPSAMSDSVGPWCCVCDSVHFEGHRMNAIEILLPYYPLTILVRTDQPVS